MEGNEIAIAGRLGYTAASIGSLVVRVGRIIVAGVAGGLAMEADPAAASLSRPDLLRDVEALARTATAGPSSPEDRQACRARLERLRTAYRSRPDLFDFSPSGRYAFISLRGKPVTGDPHALAGTESGFAVLDTQTWRVVAKVRAEGANSDIHGIATRPSGFWDWYRARR